LTYVCGQLTRNDNLNPAREGRTSPRACKRGGSHRYPRRSTDDAAVQKVTYRIELHPLDPNRPTSTPVRNKSQLNPVMIT
jgi:hypothetical protein